jgi:hypothetical protein
MSYCIKCGKQNPDTAKFCIGCGTALKAKTTGTAPTSALSTLKQDAEYKKLFGAPAKKKKNTWLIIGIIAVLGLGAGSYFIFFNKKGNNAGEAKAEMRDTATVQSTVQNNMASAIDSAAPAYPTTSNAVPLNPGTSDTEITITQTEVDEVSQVLRNFYQCENDEDISCLLNRYSFPVSRYYQLNNVSYETLHKLFTESFTEKLSYHHITIKWDYCTIQKIYDGYKAVLYADYEFIRTATPDENRSRSIQIIIHLNSSYHITTIYENQ